ncbi:hypothetical protein [Microbulbifer sp. GL-2]|uniref:hypothetical protein n=1 Tax=Microbulbifer sp. GL-2 TaxID=2591606 RepID=UPI00116326F5|nr:hypothetical protein [Microbulbifer sp. GL-2]BBM03082.1 hypothetical protein GL2_31560 [Microbulbifer sp. GL-2]
MFKKALTILISSLFIGNIVAWFSGAAPIDFKKVAYSQSETEQLNFLKAELQQDQSDTELMLQLGQLYSYHNEIEQADDLLGTAFQEDPDNMLVKAAYFSNEGKMAGAMFDPAMGIYKLYRLRHAMSQVDEAAVQASSDFNVRLVRLLTFSFVGEISGHFDRVFEDEEWFNTLIDEDPKALPAEIRQLVYLALANAYRIKGLGEDSTELNIASDYYQKAKNLADCPSTMQDACEQLSKLVVTLGEA